ncbi:4a-hydroxytetrahydrobiopterin dehydratase [Dehalococcoidia bacterium]|nr:4a-hydroxytetrahydrobiopterin dehydratase [Dehalococcoidia bacterium]
MKKEKLTDAEVESNVKNLEGWNLIQGQLERNFVFDTFGMALEFVNKVGRIAEEQNHHPDLFIQYNKIKCSVMSHDVSAITTRDITLAKSINKLI